MRRYITKNLEVYLVSDIMTNHVRNPRVQQRADWFVWLDKIREKNGLPKETGQKAIDVVDAVESVIAQIP